MSSYILFRLLKGLVVVLLIAIATFIIMRLMPGDPVYLLLGEGQVQITQEQIDAIHRRWGLDKPYHEQFFIWLGNMFRGDFGDSLVRTGVPVRQMIFEAIPVTAKLNLFALGLALIIAIPLGILSALKRNSLIDYITSVGSVLGIATPNFWLGLMLIVIFAAELRWLPPFGLRSWKGYILPVLVMATEEMAIITRITRGAVLEILPQDYVRTAKAKGLGSRLIIWRHILANALLPIVTVIGFRFAFILSGTIVIETVFALPGIGRLFTDSVMRLDYQVVQSLVVIFALLVVVVNLLTDLLYAVIDPRIRMS
ncbi:MAG: ABC transporter permease [Deinococcales bacterium]